MLLQGAYNEGYGEFTQDLYGATGGKDKPGGRPKIFDPLSGGIAGLLEGGSSLAGIVWGDARFVGEIRALVIGVVIDGGKLDDEKPFASVVVIGAETTDGAKFVVTVDFVLFIVDATPVAGTGDDILVHVTGALLFPKPTPPPIDFI